jgi:hypothetical protein
LSEALVTTLTRPPGSPLRLPVIGDGDVLADEDAQLALRIAYDLHYTTFAGVDEEWEWDPGLLAAVGRLERAFVDALIDAVGPPVPMDRSRATDAIEALASGDGPSLSRYAEARGTWGQLREFVVHRSAYQRKEADPHTWAIPRLRGRAKAAIVMIQHDEYGAGVPDDVHAELFALTMRAFGLDPAYGAYVDWLPAATLATDNLPTLFGLHRRWRAACVGHLALFEMTSVGPMGRYSRALERLGIAAPARRFYDAHVVADALHECIALDDMVTGLLDDDPESAGALVFGARALAEVEGRFTQHLLSSWATGTSLRRALPPAAIAGRAQDDGATAVPRAVPA